jgi:hypothetical protein
LDALTESKKRKPVFVWQDQTQFAARLAQEPQFLADRMRIAAVDGDVDAQLGLAHMLLNGHGLERDAEAAFHWFQIAARSGHLDAINMLGRCHELGWGTPLNTPLAAQCYRVAADLGHAWAQFNLASLMLLDDAVDGDTAEILSLLVRSARRGNAKAMNLLGQACEEGWRGRPKLEAARRWYRRAARGGCFHGWFNTARHQMAADQLEETVASLRQSVTLGPGNFCHELGQYLSTHPDPRLREISAMALEKARAAPEVPAAWIPEPALPSSTPKSRQPHPSRSRRAIRRMLGAFSGSGRNG